LLDSIHPVIFGPMDPFTPVLSVYFCTLVIDPGGKAAGTWR
jgi:hypothetical protein